MVRKLGFVSPTRLLIGWNTLSQILGKFITAGITFLVSIIIARAFGAEGYGDFTKITTFVALFYLLADFGMNAIYLQNGKAVWGELLGIRVVGSIMLMFLALVVLVFLPQGIGQGYTGAVRLGIIVFLPTILFQAVITTANAQFQRLLRYDLSTIAVVAGSCVTILMAWMLVRIGVIGVLGGIGIGSFASAVIALFFVQRSGSPLNIVILRSSLFSYFTRSLPLAATLIFNLIYFRVDHLILTLTRPTAEVGLYGLAYKVFEFPLAIPTFFMNSVYPLLLTQQAQSSKFKAQNVQNIVWKSGIFLLLTSLFLLLVFWLAAPLLTMIRSEFGHSVGVLRVLSLSLPFFFLTSLTMWALIALKRQTILAVIYGVSMVMNVIFNAWLVPVHGYMAAAWVTVGSEALVLIFSGVVLQHYLRNL